MNRSMPLIVFLLLVNALVSQASADDLNQEFHGMKWGSSVATRSKLVKVHDHAPAAYYTNSDIAYQVSGTQISSVVYGFYNDQLYAAFIKLNTPVQFSNLKRHFSTRYGEPTTTHPRDDGLIVYRWKKHDIKIKLKLRKSTNDMKLAFYYAPLADKLNQELLDPTQMDSWSVPEAGKGKPKKEAPLLPF